MVNDDEAEAEDAFGFEAFALAPPAAWFGLGVGFGFMLGLGSGMGFGLLWPHLRGERQRLTTCDPAASAERRWDGGDGEGFPGHVHRADQQRADHISCEKAEHLSREAAPAGFADVLGRFLRLSTVPLISWLLMLAKEHAHFIRTCAGC